MDVSLCYDFEDNRYHVYRGIELMLDTASLKEALNMFEKLCDQFVEIK